MRLLKSSTHKVFCAFCRIPREVFVRKHLGFYHFFASFLLSMICMYLIWGNFDPRFIVLFILFTGLTEGFLLFRWRLSLNCPYCGFDPVLYAKDPQRLTEKVSEKLKVRKASADYLLSRKNPLKDLPKRKIKKESGLVSQLDTKPTPLALENFEFNQTANPE